MVEHMETHHEEDEEECENETNILSKSYKARGIDDLDIIDINVSGEIFQTFVSTLEKYPETLLGNPVQRLKFWNRSTGQLFFDRHSESFESILYYYQSEGVLCLPEEVSTERFVDELHFFAIDKGDIEKFELDYGIIEPFEIFELPSFPPFRTVWVFLEYPDCSTWAQLFAMISDAITMISLALFVVETVPSVHDSTQGSDHQHRVDEIGSDFDTTSWLFICSTIVILWFTIEFLLRLVVCPSKIGFFLVPLNLIDLVSILPYYVALVSRGSNSRILIVIRVIRVIRVLKLSRHSSSLKVLGRALIAAREELAIICCFLVIFVLLFSSLVYYAEDGFNPKTKFRSIPQTAWWAIVTLTSAGYGDMAPVSVWGRLIGAFAAVFSILVCVLPVPSIVSHFAYFTERERKRQAAAKKRLVPQSKPLLSKLISQLSQPPTPWLPIYLSPKSSPCLSNSSTPVRRKETTV